VITVQWSTELYYLFVYKIFIRKSVVSLSQCMLLKKEGGIEWAVLVDIFVSLWIIYSEDSTLILVMWRF